MLTEFRTHPPRASIARASEHVRRDELAGSLAIARSPLTAAELANLLDRGIASGDFPLAAYIQARDAASAGAWIAGQYAIGPGDPRPIIGVEDVRRLHSIATASEPAARPGAWRLHVLERTRVVIAPPPWSVPAEMGALADRFRRRPEDRELAAWIASWLARFARIQPFTAGNGRVARLSAALLLRRIDAPALAIAPADAAKYRAALGAAVAGQSAGLAGLVERALVASAQRVIAAGGQEPLVSLRTFAPSHSYAALVKAAQRGRLRTIERNGRRLTTPGWVAEYERSRHERA